MRTLSDMQRAYDARSDDEPEEPEDGGFLDIDPYADLTDEELHKIIQFNQRELTRLNQEWRQGVVEQFTTILERRQGEKP